MSPHTFMKKPLSFIPQLLQTTRLGQRSAPQPILSSPEDITSTATTASVENEGAHFTTTSHGDGSFPALMATPVNNKHTRADLEDRNPVAPGRDHDNPFSPPTSNQSPLFVAAQEDEEDMTTKWAPKPVSYAGSSGVARFDTAQTPQGSRSGVAVDEPAYGAYTPPDHSPQEGHGRTRPILHQGGVRRELASGGSLSRFSEDIAHEASDTITGARERHVTFAETTQYHLFNPGRAHVRQPTPPLHTRHIDPIHQMPGQWDSIGAKAALQHWIADFIVFHDEFEAGLRIYFYRWFERFLFRGARRLLRATWKVPKALKALLDNISVLPHSDLTAIEKLDMDLRLCMDEARNIYESMTRRSRSTIGPLKGKNLAWRKHMIEYDLGPRMESVAGNLRLLERQANEISCRVPK